MNILKARWRPLALAVTALLAVALASLLIYFRKTDRGFIHRKCSASEGVGAVHWRPQDYPIPVYTDLAYLPAARDSTRDWNALLGKSALRPPELLDAAMKYRDPVVLILGKPTKGHAKAHMKWTLGCALRRVEISYPALSNADAHKVLMHELGHALGLDHDDFEDWVMHPSYQFVGNHVSPQDIAKLQETFR